VLDFPPSSCQHELLANAALSVTLHAPHRHPNADAARRVHRLPSTLRHNKVRRKDATATRGTIHITSQEKRVANANIILRLHHSSRRTHVSLHHSERAGREDEAGRGREHRTGDSHTTRGAAAESERQERSEWRQSGGCSSQTGGLHQERFRNRSRAKCCSGQSCARSTARS